MKESVQLAARGGGETVGNTEVTRFSSGRRMGQAAGIAVGGILLGAATIVIPGVHLISTWAIPLLSFGIAAYLFSRRGVIGAVTGECPSCHQQMNSPGGAWEDPMWVRCNQCEAPVEVKLSTPM